MSIVIATAVLFLNLPAIEGEGTLQSDDPSESKLSQQLRESSFRPPQIWGLCSMCYIPGASYLLILHPQDKKRG